MQGRISNIISLFLITILCIVGVEGLYQAMEFFVFKPAALSKKVIKDDSTPTIPPKDSKDQRPDYRMILKRNLFARPDGDTGAVTPDATEETDSKPFTELGIVLMGTISGSDNNNRAIILTKQTRDQEIFSTGEVIQGALIKDIQRGKLVLEINGQDEILDMTEAAEMRPAYTAPRKSPAGSSSRSAILRGNQGTSNVNATPVPRRRVVRRARATQNTPRPSAN